MTLSLLDTANRFVTVWYVCYCDADKSNPQWWNKNLKPGYQHVHLRGAVKYGPELDDVLWILVDPGLAQVYTSIHSNGAMPWEDPSVKHVQRVTSVKNPRRVREWFSFGPITCVEIAKVYLGIDSWRVRTPWQLFKYIRDRGCLLE